MNSNLPITESSLDSTVQAFNEYYEEPIELNATEYGVMVGFFTNKGFDKSAAETIAVVVMTQARKDGYSAMKILDTLKGLSSVELTALLAEILNFNRLSTSNIGIAQEIRTNQEIDRNVIIPIISKTYSVTPSSATIREGDTITFNINTINVKNGTPLYWSLSGTINVNDIQNTSTNFVVVNENTASVSIKVLTDTTVENNETMIFNLKNDFTSDIIVATASISIVNTSFSLVADYIVIEYTFNSGLDLDTRTRLISPAIGSYVGWAWPELTPLLLEWGGDNTGQGTETALINISNIRFFYPSLQEILVDCRAMWYEEVGSTPVGITVNLYKGGTMVKTEYSWINPTATNSSTLSVDLKNITLLSQNPNNIGQRVATMTYNLSTGQGYFDPSDQRVFSAP